MLKQSLRPTLYLLVSILIGITVTLVMDSFANIAVEKKIRRELKQEIEAAATSFKEAYKTTTPNEVLFFLRKFSSSSLSDKIVAVNPNDEKKTDSRNFSYLFTYTEGNSHIDYYILNSFLQRELAILETPELMYGLFTTIFVFTFIVVYKEKKKQALAMQQQFEMKQAEFRKVLEEHEALALIGRMVATLAHEMKTPIATISNLVQILPTRIRDEKFTDRFMTLTKDELGRAQQLINNLLAYGKEIEIGQEEWISLTTFIAEIASKYTLQLNTPVSVEVYGDRFYLELLLDNLLRNSRQAGADKIQLKVLTGQAEDNSSAKILLEDNGAGFAAGADLDTLFDPFITYRSRGAGLGLYLANKIVTAHNGKIALYRMEHGAGVSILFPQKRIMMHEQA
ncbi:MAG: HAMP domain-containing sensor histidine kinase [Syntrophales bacterium]